MIMLTCDLIIKRSLYVCRFFSTNHATDMKTFQACADVEKNTYIESCDACKHSLR